MKSVDFREVVLITCVTLAITTEITSGEPGVDSVRMSTRNNALRKHVTDRHVTHRQAIPPEHGSAGTRPSDALKPDVEFYKRELAARLEMVDGRRSYLPDPHGGAAGVEHVPRHMKQIYLQRIQQQQQELEAGDRTADSKPEPDIVRSINAQLGYIYNSTMFVFNLTSLSANEHIISGQIHTYKKSGTVRTHRMTPSRLKTKPGDTADSGDDDVTQYLLTVFELSPSGIRQLEMFPISTSGRSGWQSFDVSSTVRHFVSGERTSAGAAVMAVSFSQQATKPGRSNKRLLLSNFNRRFSKPVLLVFSRQVTDDSVSDVKNMAANEEFDGKLSSLHSPSSKRAEQEQEWINVPTRSSRPEHRFDVHASSTDDDVIKRRFRATKNVQQRIKRSIDNNEIPDGEDDEHLNMDDHLRHHPEVEREDEIVNLPPNSPDRSPHRTRTEVRTTSTGYSNQTTPVVKTPKSTLLQFLSTTSPSKNNNVTEAKSAQRRRNRHRQHQHQSRRRIVATDAGVSTSTGVKVEGSTFGWTGQQDDGSCKKRRMMVDFADIGWADWVMSPKSFEAFYCDGLCRFPIDKSLKPTNHANLQSMIRAVGINKAVPSPCCVPSSMSSLTLLYVDETGNYVLRSFPDMIVRSCSCR